MKKKIAILTLTLAVQVSAFAALGDTTKIVSDFNGDGRGDVLWQTSDGLSYISLMNGVNVQSCSFLNGSTLSILGAGDFNGDGKSDIVWRNMTTGNVSISLMNGSSIIQWLSVSTSPIALITRLEGIGDFDGDGKAEMLWRNQSTGRTVLSQHASDGTVIAWPQVSASINVANTTALKIGDINGDGKDDIVWRNMSTGNVVISLMNGATVTNWKQITASPISPTVKLEAIGDFDGNGKADLLWRNTSTGNSLLSYHATDGGVSSWPQVATFINPNNTKAEGAGDFNGDGKSDIFWRNTDSGNTVISLMNGNIPSWQPTNVSTGCAAIAANGVYYSAQASVNSANTADQLANNMGNIGYGFMSDYATANATQISGIYEFSRNDKGNFRNKSINTQGMTVGDKLNLLNSQGTLGYSYKGDLFLSNLNYSRFIKNDSSSATFSYLFVEDSLNSASTFLSKLNAQGQLGYRFVAVYSTSISGSYAVLFEKSNNATQYEYQLPVTATSAATFLTQANNLGNLGYAFKGPFSFGASASDTRDIYVKKVGSTDKYVYSTTTANMADGISTLISQINAQGALGKYWMGAYYFGTSLNHIFYTGKYVCHSLTGCSRPGGL